MSETTAVDRPKSLEERVNDRLRENLGDIITPDDLRLIVDRGIEQILFHPRVVKRDYGREEVKPSLVEEMVDNHLGKEIREQVSAWMRDNPEIMQQAVNRAMDAGIAAAVMRAMDDRFAGIFEHGVSRMEDMGWLQERP